MSVWHEVSWHHGAEAIDACKYLFLFSLREVEELTLEVLCAEGIVGESLPPTERNQPWAELLTGGRPVNITTSNQRFRLLFESRHLASYTVLNESYGRFPEPLEQFRGTRCRTFSTSHLLHYTRERTNASDAWPGPLQHYQLVTENHILDVTATAPPLVSIAPVEGDATR